MPAPTLRQGSEKALRNLCSSLAKAVAENIGSLVGVDIEVQTGRLDIVDVEEHFGGLHGQTMVVRGSLAEDHAGHTLWIAFDSRDAATMAGLMMMSPEDVIEERRQQGAIGDEELEVFGEIGNILCSGIDECLRKTRGDGVGLRLRDHSALDPGSGDPGLLGEEPLVVYEFPIRIGSFEPSQARLLLDIETAERWNGNALVASADAAGGHRQGPAGDSGADADDDDEELPPAEVRGQLAAYLFEGEIWPPLRRCCRRVGFEVERHGPAEIPNPAAHKGEVVLIEVPANDDRRFDWCRRLKTSPHGIRVVLYLHLPTRQRVLAGFMAQADVILGPPLSTDLLREKLESLLG